jgi:hypothetical protein
MMIIVDGYVYFALRKGKKLIVFLILDETSELYDELCLYIYILILIMTSIQGGNRCRCNVGGSRIIGNEQNQSLSVTLFAH